ncbi:putative membrane protein [Novosphingobium hassiacum]|uniref:Putative membrane protein n=1 Tax=Novosphingobium hassiacum TaxID=173676 RepID=A0A7W6EW93_9SPHN|nr:putative membrane protein [Novosphingobium hassiacum]
MSQDYRPTWRKPIGIILLMLALVLYAAAIAAFSGTIGQWHVAVQTVVYIVLGVAWLLPLRRFLIWMETGRWG